MDFLFSLTASRRIIRRRHFTDTKSPNLNGIGRVRNYKYISKASLRFSCKVRIHAPLQHEPS